MKGGFLALAAWTLLLPACGQAAEPPAQPASPDFPALTGRVVDQADLPPEDDERRIAVAAEAVERERGPQFVVVTVAGLQGHSIEGYGVRLGRRWGIGSAERNDGVILLVAPNERKVRIEVGYGLESRVTDPFAARVIREHVLPRFREQDMRGGILAGSEAVLVRLRSRQTDREIAEEDHLVI